MLGGQYNPMKTMKSSVRPPLLLAGLMLHLAATCALAGLPSGPQGPGRFGAYQTRLAFTPEWDAPWRVGPRCDVVVRFDHTAARLVFWHGANYVPCWVNEAGQWYSDGAVLRPGAGPQQDRLCRFAFASVIESSDARVVVRWRYALVDAKGELIHADPVTRWNDWVDECYTIYPDASGVRSVTLHSSEWSQPYWVQQSLLIRQPGEPAQALGLAPASHALTGGQLQTIPIKGGTFFHAVAAPADNVDLPESWGDWPARGAAEPAGHEFIGALRWQPWAGTRTSKSWRMLVGLASGSGADSEILTAAQAWLTAAPLELAGADFTSAGYQADERAYLLHSVRPGTPGVLKLTLAGTSSEPLVNPAFVIKGWGKSAVSLSVNGTPVPRGPAFRYGYRKTVAAADLIVWTRCAATAATSFELQPLSHANE